MFNVFLSYVSDVQQIVNVVQINECIVVSQVFNDIFNFSIFLQSFKQFIMFYVVFRFDNCMMRNNNVVMFLVQFDNFEFQFFVFQVSSVMDWMYVNQRIWQECMDIVQFNSEIVFNFIVNDIDNSCSFFVSFFKYDLSFMVFCFFMRKLSFVEIIFNCVQSYVYLRIYLNFQFVSSVFELFSRDSRFRFQVSINQNVVVFDCYYSIFNDSILLELGFVQKFFKELSKRFSYLFNF